MDPKVGKRTHSRKYVGVVLEVSGRFYFAPLSSPKPRDYDSNGNIKQNTSLSIPMIVNGLSGKRLLGTIKLNDMIPVPMSEIVDYDLSKESDSAYADLVRDELRFINKHQEIIRKRARIIYQAKIHERLNLNPKNARWFSAIVPFRFLESLCDSFMSQVAH